MAIKEKSGDIRCVGLATSVGATNVASVIETWCQENPNYIFLGVEMNTQVNGTQTGANVLTSGFNAVADTAITAMQTYIATLVDKQVLVADMIYDGANYRWWVVSNGAAAYSGSCYLILYYMVNQSGVRF